MTLAATLRILADPVRAAILEPAGGRVAVRLPPAGRAGAKQTLVSHHLRALREAGMVCARAVRAVHLLPAAPGASTRPRPRRRSGRRQRPPTCCGAAGDEVGGGPPVTASPRRLLAEGARHRVLVAVVVGSGIAAQRLSPDDLGLQLLENSSRRCSGSAC